VDVRHSGGKGLVGEQTRCSAKNAGLSSGGKRTITKRRKREKGELNYYGKELIKKREIQTGGILHAQKKKYPQSAPPQPSAQRKRSTMGVIWRNLKILEKRKETSQLLVTGRRKIGGELSD